ncbi:MBL fold metallo-hydrolase [Curvibacter lanceolatus]|uniref:MBL fold metallo-hydrolase n=1 Tax=Curvibacter lanceolatus TaxID=86182 RepID=UPI002356C010|nr:MBL fold metallo-hydrolase [Curvibacter lanceolatus]
MARTALITSIALAVLTACSTIAPQQATVDQHVHEAQSLAGDDLKFLLPVCNPQPAVRAAPSPAMDEMLAKLIQQTPPAPGQAFDNLYYVGSAWVSAWVLKTSDGLILIDALNNAQEATELVEGGMRRLGLDPAQIRYVLVTHGHGDHYGGAQMLADRYHARVVASEIDWKMMETTLEFDSRLWDRPPRRDIAVRDGDTLTLGDTTVRFVITPGHTLGTITPVFEVRDKGQKHTAMIWGGTAFNFGRDMARLDSYIAQTERMRQLSAQWGIDVPLSNHPGYDGTVAKLKATAAVPTGPNPFVSGQPVVDRAMRVLNACARAQKARFLLTADSGAGNETGVATATSDAHTDHDEHLLDGSLLALGQGLDAAPVAFPRLAAAAGLAGSPTHPLEN